MGKTVSEKLVGFTQNAHKVLKKRYLKKDEEGQVVEGPVALFKRVARHIASADANYGRSAD